MTSPVVKEIGIDTLGSEVKFRRLINVFALEMKDKPQGQARHHILEEIDFSAEEASEGSADGLVEEGVKKVSKREEVVKDHNPERVARGKLIDVMSQADVLTGIFHSLVKSLGAPLRAVELESSDCLSICAKAVVSLRKARVGYSSIQRRGVDISIVEKLGEKDCSSEESLE